jgi:hypothetical protein
MSKIEGAIDANAPDSLTKAEAILWAYKDIWSVDEAALLLSGISVKNYLRLRRNYDTSAFTDEKEFRIAANRLQAFNDDATSVRTVLQRSQPAAETPAGWVKHAEIEGLEVSSVLKEAIENNALSGASERGGKAFSITTHKIKTRSNVLDAVIKLAKESATAPSDYQSVWAELVSLAESKSPPAPLAGYSSDGIQYRGKRYELEQVPDVFTKDNLRKRMNKNAR